MDRVALQSKTKSQVDGFRQEFLKELPVLAREYIDTARAEATTAAYEKVMNTALKVIDGLEVAKQADKYANLPVINFVIGADMAVTTTITPAVDPDPSADIEDAVVKSPFGSSSSAEFGTLPEDVLDLLAPPEPAPATAAEMQATLDALDAAAGAFALD